MLHELTFPSTMTALTMGAMKPMVLETVLSTPRSEPVWLGARSVMASCDKDSGVRVSIVEVQLESFTLYSHFLQSILGC